MIDYSSKTILVADSHLDESGKHLEDFFLMLERFEKTNCSRVVFMGDIFELWIALDGYEEPCHKRFISWCSKNKHFFEIGFIEGNHEFFVSKYHRDAFSWSSDIIYEDPSGIVFIHGDTVNSKDWKYLLLRKAIRNRFSEGLLKIFSGSTGPSITHKIRLSLKTSNMEHKKFFPHKEMELFVGKYINKSADTIVSGHFHSRVSSGTGNIKTEILPAWHASGMIGIIENKIPHKLDVISWKEL